MKPLFPLLLSFVFLLGSQQSKAVDYYWIGGSGNWSNISNWATTSGGVITHAVVPSADDNVIFDANSFTAAGQVITLDADNVFCLNMDWSAAPNNPTFRGVKGQIINVFGALTLTENMTFDFKGDFLFRTTLADARIQTAGHALGESIYFDGSGNWVLDGALTVDSLIQLTNGFLNTNDQLIVADYFYVEVSNEGGLELGSSSIRLDGDPFFVNGNSADSRTTLWIRPIGNFTIDPGTSLFDLTSASAVFKVDYSNISFNDVTFSSASGGTNLDLVGGENISFNVITCNTHHFFTNSFTANQVNLSPGKVYRFQSGGTYTMDQLIANGSCTASIILEGTTDGNFATFQSSMDINVDFVSLNNIHASGSGIFTANNTIDLGNNDGWLINARAVGDLFWVGGQGNWEDPMNWSFSSGGPGGACVPSSSDNVIFDANSFSGPGQTVRVNAENIYCRDMIWTGAGGRPVFSSDDDKFIHINGSLTFIRNMDMDFKGQFLFEGKNLGQSIRMAGHWITSSATFNAIGGEWILQDSFLLNLSLFLTAGTLNTNDQYIETFTLKANLTNPRGLILGASTWALHTNGGFRPFWELNSQNLNFDAGTSTIYFKEITGTLINYGDEFVKYHKVVFDNDYSSISRSSNAAIPIAFDTVEYRQGGFIYSDIKINSLRLTAGFTYRWAIGTQLEVDTIMGNGNCDGLITIGTVTVGTPAKMQINKDHPNLQYFSIGNVHNTGSGIVTASQSIDLGNTEGWIINEGTGRVLYWVGGNGNWEDRNHWSLSSGGPGGECIPGPRDDVIFDQNSFSGPNQRVTGVLLDIYYCRNMTWSNIPSGTSIQLDQLRCFGNLELTQPLNWSVGVIYFRGNNDHTLLTQGVNLSQIRFESSGTHTLLDPLFCYSAIFSECDFFTSDFDFTTTEFSIISYANLAKLTLGSSHIRINGEANGASFPFRVINSQGVVEIVPGTSLIEFTGTNSGLSSFGDLQFNNLLFSSTTGQGTLYNTDNRNLSTLSYNKVQFNNDGLIRGLHAFDSLYFASGKSYQLAHGLTQKINSHLQIIGNNCTPIQLSSTQAGIPSTIQMTEGTVNGDFIQMQDQIAEGGATFYAGVHSTNINNSNIGWIFETRENFTDVGFLGTDAVICNGMPVTLSAFSYSPGEQYLWSDGTTSAEVTVSSPTTLWARVTFANSCEIIDTIQVIAGENFEANLGPDTLLCNGDSLLLNVNSVAAGLEVTWQDGTSESEFLVNQAGEYSVSLQLQGCEERDTILVSFTDPPVVDIGDDLTFCEGQSSTLDATSAGNNVYTWNDGSNTPQLTISQTGLYKVSVSNGSCTTVDSLQATVFPIPLLDLGGDSTLCESASLALSLNTTGTILWQDGSSNNTFLITQPGIYWAEVNENNCTNRDSIQIQYTPNPIVDLGQNETLCENESLTLDASQLGPASYQWQDGSTQASLVADQSGLYKVVVTSNNCTAADSVQLTFNPLPRFNLGPDTSFCEGNTLALSFPGLGDTYLWQDGSTSDQFSIQQQGIFWLDVVKDGCSFRDSIQVDIRPLPIVDLGQNETLCENESLTLDASQQGPASYQWQDGSTQPSLVVDQSGLYKVVVMSNNCSATDSVQLTFNPLPRFNLGPDTSFCEGNTLALSFPGLGDTYLWQDGSSSDQFSIQQQGIFWLDVVKDGCSFRDSIQVDIRPLPIVDLGQNETLCENESLALDASQQGPASYQWQDGSTQASLVADQSGLYKVVVTSNNCTAADSVHLTFNPLPRFNLGPDTSFCEGNNLALSFPGIGDTYLWQDGSSSDQFSIQQQGIFWLDVVKDGCSFRDSIQVGIKPLPVFSIGEDILACEGESITLEAMGDAESYLWNGQQTGSTFTVTSSQEVVALASLDGCEDTRSVNITFNPNPIVDLGPDRTSCEGEAVILRVEGEGASVTWQDGSSESTYPVNTSGIYSVSTTLNNCTSSDTVTINFNPSPSVDLGPDLTACQGETLDISANISNADEFMWNTGSIDASLRVDQSGTYWVEASLGSCFKADTVLVSFQAPGMINLGNDTVLCQGSSLLLSSTLDGTYLWQDGSTSPQFSADSSGLYRLTVDDGVCISTDSIRISFVSCGDLQIFFPNVFSPNADGVNDGFKPFVDPSYEIVSYQLRIFDRWGGFVYESQNPDDSWSGRARNELVSSGIYVYFLDITIRDQRGERSELLSGDVMLLR